MDQDCEMQLSDLRKMAESRGLEIVAEHVDSGISGARDSRPELSGLMKDARRGKFKAVLVWRFDRFARSLKHLVMALEEFKSLGIEFLSHQEAVDTSTPAGRMLFQVIGAMAEFEREIIRERVIAGLRQAKQKGTKLGRPRLELDYETARDPTNCVKAVFHSPPRFTRTKVARNFHGDGSAWPVTVPLINAIATSGLRKRTESREAVDFISGFLSKFPSYCSFMAALPTVIPVEPIS